MKIVFDAKSLDYRGTLGFPERLVFAYDYLKDKVSFARSQEFLKEPKVHTKELIQKVKTGNFFEPDSPAYEYIYEHAMRAVNGAITAQKIQGFALIEPPGHHAGRNFLGGFCYFNNIAEAVSQSRLKTLIIDIDGHYGNGTEDIFSGSEKVFYISLHRSPCYPGTGLVSGKNFINKPLPADCREKIYIKMLKESINDMLKIFRPEQIAVSAGFDTYKNDPLASLGLTEKTYYRIGEILKQTAQKTNSELFAVLEGGYTKELGKLIHEFISGIEN